jgi:hypothetical protein
MLVFMKKGANMERVLDIIHMEEVDHMPEEDSGKGGKK